MSALASSSKRRAKVRRNVPRAALDLGSLVRRREFVNTVVFTIAFVLAMAALVITSSERVGAYVGQVMHDTRLTRVPFSVVDPQRTKDARQTARARSPEVYVINTAYLESLRTPLLNLPVIGENISDIAEFETGVREGFQLDLSDLAPLQLEVENGEPSPRWKQAVEALLTDKLVRHPLIDDQLWQSKINVPPAPLLLDDDGNTAAWSDQMTRVRSDAPEETRQAIERHVIDAGFPPELAPNIAARLTWKPEPDFEFRFILEDEDTTTELADQAEAAVQPVLDEHKPPEILYKRGDVLTSDQHELLGREAAAYEAEATFADRWMPRFGIIGLIAILGGFIVGYVVLFYQRITRNPFRLAAIWGLLVGMLGISALVAAEMPKMSLLGAVAPPLFIAVTLRLAYDQRLALALSGMHCALVTMALNQNIGMFILLYCGCSVAIAQLREVRHRNTLIRTAGVTAIVLAIGSALLDAFTLPIVDEVWPQIVVDSLLAAVGSFTVGFVMLGILPSVERLFDITTGMTLAELRDPKQPLLRQLQEKAPGTYNHSLQVANIAEAAADSIGADGLLVYVGALYHDIGKLNKPEYFVENQIDGANKHDKLSPAMSLLVIVGHVKDGVELAREYALPRTIQHFIESHHGTTLVEYFYEAARTQAEAEEKTPIQEVAYRYPGPKPRTREAAILMLADAVESSTRAMADPTPGRIESLVRELSHKRLTDGQFDQSDLTFRELGQIEDTIIKTVCAIYHSRISYPSTREVDEEGQPRAETPTGTG